MQQNKISFAGTRGRISQTVSGLPACRHVHRYRLLQAAPAAVATLQTVLQDNIAVSVEKSSWTSRKIHANVTIAAPVDTVWDALTDYEQLGTFIPSLVESRCIRRTPHGSLVYQVGAQELALGLKFKAACTLDCREYLHGIPDNLCSANDSGAAGLIPRPKAFLPGRAHRDIAFWLVEGDFKAFRGLWRMQQATVCSSSVSSSSSSSSSSSEGSGSSSDSGNDFDSGESTCSNGTLLCYSVYVQPQAWLPVRLIQERIEKEVRKNLCAIQQHTEGLQLMRKHRSLAYATGCG